MNEAFIVTHQHFRDFCKDLLSAIKTDTGFHPPGDVNNDDIFACVVSNEQPFSKHEGMCFNFVSWLFFKAQGNVGTYRPGGDLYDELCDEDVMGQSWQELYADSLSITRHFFAQDKMDDEERVCDRSSTFPFGDAVDFVERRYHGTFYKDVERIKFLEQVCA